MTILGWVSWAATGGAAMECDERYLGTTYGTSVLQRKLEDEERQQFQRGWVDVVFPPNLAY